MDQVEVIVIGGGIIGSAAAEALARRGSDVLLLERFAPGHDRGSSHGDGRIIRYAYEAPHYVQMAAQAFAGWDALGRRAGRSLLHITGGVDLGRPGDPALAAIERNYRTFDLPHERLSAAALHRRFPHFAAAPEDEALFQPDAGVVRADLALQALHARLAAEGGRALFGTHVTGIVPGSRPQVRTTSGRLWRAERIVLAAGAWTAPLLTSLGPFPPLRVTNEQVGYFREHGTLSHAPDQMPVLVDRRAAHVFYALPRLALGGVKVGWDHSGPEVGPDDPRSQDSEIQRALRAYVRQTFPHLDDAPTLVHSCLYTSTADEDFILDRWAQEPNIVVGAGFSGHGFKFAPVIGEALAALALDDAPPFPLAPFRLARPALA